MDTSERQALIRGLRQRMEALGRAGIDRVVIGELPTVRSRRVSVRAVANETVVAPVARAEPIQASQPSRTVETARPVAAEPVPRAITRPAVTRALFEEHEFDEPLLSPDERVAALEALRAEVAVCVKCQLLAESRTQTVFGVGSPTARLMFIGEAPGFDEDRLGEPFVGKSGQLLTDMITKGLGLTREEVYIANVLRCRPPENRTPTNQEAANCLPYLERTISIVRPEFLCLLGKSAVTTLLQTMLPMNKVRGKWHRYRGIPTVATWHPSYLLRTPDAKKETWADLQLLMQAMGLKAPDRKKS